MMKEILNDALTIPGVVGGFFYHRNRGVLAVELPAVFKPDKLEKMARMLLKIFSSGKTNLNGVAEVSICYDESILVARAVDDAAYLILLCETRINLELLGMSLNLSMDDARDRVVQQVQGLHSPVESPITPMPVPADPPAVVDNRKDLLTVKRTPLEEVLQGMQTCLAKVIGPIAQIVFQDAMCRWKQHTSTNPNDLPVLMNILLSEIGEPDHKRKYQTLVTHYFEGHI